MSMDTWGYVSITSCTWLLPVCQYLCTHRHVLLSTRAYAPSSIYFTFFSILISVILFLKGILVFWIKSHMKDVCDDVPNILIDDSLSIEIRVLMNREPELDQDWTIEGSYLHDMYD